MYMFFPNGMYTSNAVPKSDKVKASVCVKSICVNWCHGLCVVWHEFTFTVGNFCSCTEAVTTSYLQVLKVSHISSFVIFNPFERKI